jgi:hypothetical protein
MDGETQKPRTRIQIRNREAILDAALEVFSQHGFRGATVDMIAAEAGLSKPARVIVRDDLLDLSSSWRSPDPRPTATSPP